MKKEKVVRKCTKCKKSFKANKYHGLDLASMDLALRCPEHRKSE